jgi:hypothetical protein
VKTYRTLEKLKKKFIKPFWYEHEGKIGTNRWRN